MLKFNKKNKRKHGKENVPELLSNSILENLLGDNIHDVVGRRSDVGKRSLHIVDSDTSISSDFNNDEKEKEEIKIMDQERLEREKATAARARPTGMAILGSLSQEELDQHYSKCIEMCNKNKVNLKNAFKLQLIDYMKLIVSNHSTKSENLTLMSCTLGASAKIYGIRVDKVYNDMVKILSGKGTEIAKDDSDDEKAENGDEEEEEVVVKKKCKSTDSSDEEEEEEAKGVNFEAMLRTEAQLGKRKDYEEELQEKSTLPVGLDYFVECRQLDPDGRFCLNPPVFPNSEIEKPSTKSYIDINLPYYNDTGVRLDPALYIYDYKNIRKCFSILDEEEGKEETLERINSSLVFDPSSNIAESILIDAEEHDNDGEVPESWGPDYDEDEALPMPNISVDGNKSGQISSIQPKSFTAETMAKLVSVNSSDYSFFDNSRIDFWAGPRHWSIKRAKGDKIHKPGEQNKRTVKKSCDLNFSEEAIKSRMKYYTDTVSALLAKKTILTWSTRRCKIPQDIAYSQKNLVSSMKNDKLVYVRKDSSTNTIYTADLNNEEETVLTPDDFGADIDDPGLHDDHSDGELANGFGDRGPSPFEDRLTLEEPAHDNELQSDLVPLPQKVNKITLKCAKAQKRIDIKQLKSVMWDTLALDKGNEEVKFSQVYSALPEKLPHEEAEQLSFPIAFMALLHMANEKNLSLSGNDDHSDVTVKLD